MAKDSFRRYIWLLDTIQRHGRLTLPELKEKWRHSSVNDEGKELAPRTFSNYKENIEQIFGIVIKCDRATNEYFIWNEDDLDGNSIRDWMLNSLSLRNLLNESAGLRDRILLEDVPSSHRFLTTVIDAMRENRKIVLSYRGYLMDEYRDMTVHPYCVRLFKRRWYLIGYSEYSKAVRLYMLDRVRDAAMLREGFDFPDNFNAETYFEDYYGVRISEAGKERVLLKVMPKIRDLVRTVPLHASQTEIETNSEYSVFELYLKPNFDFMQEVISYLGNAEVIEPVWLRREVADTLKSMYNIYSTK